MAPQVNRARPPGGPEEDRLDRLLAERGDHLLHAAVARTGSRQDAEDLVVPVGVAADGVEAIRATPRLIRTVWMGWQRRR